jgi:hypothetical protein
VWLIVRQALTVYRPGRAALFAGAAAMAAWAAWPDPSAGHAAADQFGVIGWCPRPPRWQCWHR